MTVLAFPTTNTPVIPDGCVSSTELCERAGITYRQADYWARTGILHELPRPASAGSGVPRYFPLRELAVAALMHRFLEAGLTPRAAHDLARGLLDHGHAVLAGIRIDLPQDL